MTGESCALVLPWADTQMMQMHLDTLSRQVGADRHVVLVLDNAGWHTTGRLAVPPNLTLLPLPAYTPELNVVERLWHWIKDHEFSNRIYPDYDQLADAVCAMWQHLPTPRIQTVCRCSWLHQD
jgi:transposase